MNGKSKSCITIRCTGVAGRAGFEINVVRRGPVNGTVRVDGLFAADLLQLRAHLTSDLYCRSKLTADTSLIHT
jgi:hypothetical protein